MTPDPRGNDDIYALYVNEQGDDVDAADLKGPAGAADADSSGFITAKLDLSGQTPSAQHVYNSAEIDLSSLELKFEELGSGYSIRNASKECYLELEDMLTSSAASQYPFIAQPAGEPGSFMFVHNYNDGKDQTRVLDFNLKGWNVEGNHSDHITDYWGPSTKQTGLYKTYLYVKGDLPDDPMLDAPAAHVNPATGESDEPFMSNGEGIANSDTFRIPSLITLENGWIVAAADVRWGDKQVGPGNGWANTKDSPNNIDVVVSVSKDNGATWSWELVNRFLDYADGTTSQMKDSASFIDPALVQDSHGNVHMMVDVCPAGVGNAGGTVALGTGFDAKGNLLISRGDAGALASTDLADYTHYLDMSVSESFPLDDGKSVALHPIKSTEGESTNFWVDEGYFLYEVVDAIAVPQLCLQENANPAGTTQNNIFYKQSPWKVFPTFYIGTRTGTVTDAGIEWGPLQLLDVKGTTEGFTGVCPGRGLVVPLEDGGERILFPVYDNATRVELASTVYSDDGGKTWSRGEHADQLNGTEKSSESQLVLLPDGTVRMYSRNYIQKIGYSDSLDGGVTWGPYTIDDELGYCGDCMVSFINVEGSLLVDGKAYSNLILASYPEGDDEFRKRVSGVRRVGSVDVETNNVTWFEKNVFYPYDSSKNYYFFYSCLTQLGAAGQRGDKAAIVYEHGYNNKVTDPIEYNAFTISSLVPGSTYIAGDATLDVEASATGAFVGDTVTLDAKLGSALSNAMVSWELVGDDAATMAALSAETGTTVELSALKAGSVTVRATVAAELGGTQQTLTAEVQIAISDNETTTLPDEYGENATEIYESGTDYPYQLDTDGVSADGGTYVLYSDWNDGTRLLFHYAGDEKVNHSTPRLTEDKTGLYANSGSRYSLGNQTWKFVPTGDPGEFYIQSCSDVTSSGAAQQDYRYLTDQVSKDQLVVSETPVAFTVEPASDREPGYYYVSTGAGNERRYVYFNTGSNDGWQVRSDAAAIRLYEAVADEQLDLTALTSLIADVEGISQGSYSEETWTAFQTALAAAREVAKADGTIVEDGAEALAQADTATEVLYRAYLGLAEDATPPTDPDDGDDNPGGVTPPPVHPVDPDEPQEPEEPEIPSAADIYEDVDADAWYHDSVSWAAHEGIMTGYENGYFGPEDDLSRGQMATVLYRMAGEPEVDPDALDNYTDCVDDAFYAKAVAWAAEQGIMTGYDDGSGRFDPDGGLTREQAATVLMRAAALRGEDISARADLSDYPDAEGVSSFATDAMSWAVATGVISGVNPEPGVYLLAPQGICTRAELCELLMRLMEEQDV